MAWHSTHSRENDGVRDDTLERAIRRFCRVFVGGTGTFPADNLFHGTEHVFLTCHDCPISWNRFWPGPVSVRRCFDTICSSRAGATDGSAPRSLAPLQTVHRCVLVLPSRRRRGLDRRLVK